MPQFGTSVTRVIICDCNMFIIQATSLSVAVPLEFEEFLPVRNPDPGRDNCRLYRWLRTTWCLQKNIIVRLLGCKASLKYWTSLLSVHYSVCLSVSLSPSLYAWFISFSLYLFVRKHVYYMFVSISFTLSAYQSLSLSLFMLGLYLSHSLSICL